MKKTLGNTPLRKSTREISESGCENNWGIILQPQPHIQGRNTTKIWPQNCRVCLVLKHLGPYFARIFAHSFALYAGGRGHLCVSENCARKRVRRELRNMCEKSVEDAKKSAMTM